MMLIYTYSMNWQAMFRMRPVQADRLSAHRSFA